MANPAQLISHAISNGTLRFDESGEGNDEEMDSENDESDQYHKSPSASSRQTDEEARIENATSTSSASDPSSNSQQKQSIDPSQKTQQLSQASSTPSKLGPGPDSPFTEGSSSGLGSMLSPPSAVMGVQSTSPASKTDTLPSDK